MYYSGALRDAGWRPEAALADHDFTSAVKLCNPDKCVSHKSYLLCLLDRDSLLALGCENLSATKTESYYKVVLHVNPRVADTERDKYYKDLLKGKPPPDVLGILDEPREQAFALEDVAAPEPLCDNWDEVLGDAVDDGVVVLSSFATGPVFRPPGILKRPAARAIADVPVAPVIRDASSPAEEPADDGIVVHGSGTPFTIFKFGLHILGHAITYNEYSDHARKYARFVVTCPCAVGKHKEKGKSKCTRSRTLSKEHMSHLGIAEIYGFLGVWLQEAASYPDRLSHIKAPVPTLERIRTFCSEQGWLE